MKYLTFTLAGQSCGIELSCVRELLGYMPFTPTPADHPSIVGYFDLRGRSIRVLDLRIRMGLPVTRTDDTVMIVVDCAGETLAMIVDSVTGLENLATLAPVTLHPRMRIDPRCLLGTARVGDHSLSLLDLARTIIIPPPLPKAA